MTKTIIRSRFNPKYKIKSTIEMFKPDTSHTLPPNIQSFKQKLLSGNGSITYKYFYV